MKRIGIAVLVLLLHAGVAHAAPLDLNAATEQDFYTLIAKKSYTDKGKAVNAPYCRDNAKKLVAGRPYTSVAALLERAIISKTLYDAIRGELTVKAAAPGPAAGTGELPFPKRIDLTAKQSPVRDQARRNTCTAFSSVAGMEAHDKSLDLSEQLMYFLARDADPDKKKCLALKYNPSKPDECDDKCSGMTLETAVKVMRNQGLYAESVWPYDRTDNLTPGVSCQEFATWASKLVAPAGKPVVKLGKVVWLSEPGYGPKEKRVDDPMVLMAILAKGYAVNIVIDVAGHGWNDGRMIDVELDPVTKKPLKSEGGHGLLLVAYDFDKKAFKFKNSWGDDWGDGGYGWMTFDYLKTYVYGGYYATGLVR
jgi:hypothetical protein